MAGRAEGPHPHGQQRATLAVNQELVLLARLKDSAQRVAYAAPPSATADRATCWTSEQIERELADVTSAENDDKP